MIAQRVVHRHADGALRPGRCGRGRSGLPGAAPRLAAAAREQPFLTLDAFLAHPALARSTLDAEDLGVSSRYRWLQVDIRLQRLDYRRLTLLREGIVVRRERRYPGDT